MQKIFSKLVILVLGLMFLGGCMNRPTKEEMIAELKKPEVVKVIEESLKNMDENAFAEGGVIKHYEIDYNTVRKHPMGGLTVMTYINGDTELYNTINLDKNERTGKYTVSGSYSSKLDAMLRGK